jgi:hypothetical protein
MLQALKDIHGVHGSWVVGPDIKVKKSGLAMGSTFGSKST